MSGSIRLYTKKPLAIFSYLCEEQRQTVPPPFPDFRIFPEQLYRFSYHDRRDDPGRLTVTIAFAENDRKVKVHGFAG
jgi:hypothetical protein